MEKYDNFFLDKYPCSKTNMLVFEQGHLSRKNLSKAIFARVNYFSSALVKENLSYFPFTVPRETCQGEVASVYSRQVFLDKGTCRGKLASVNEALHFTAIFAGLFVCFCKGGETRKSSQTLQVTSGGCRE